MKAWKALYLSDLKRYGECKPRFKTRRILKWFRKCSTPSKNRLIKFFDKAVFYIISRKNFIEFSDKNVIGGGLYIGHAFGITLNPNVTIGKNCNIHRGVSIGQENRGKRKGVPTIGDEVWIGNNATIVGNITIGDDVLIASNAFVNCDVPSHSVVVGNPCVIKNKENATKDYINNKI